ncbi:unnamed protein product [Aphanomyces euteiches]
MDATSAETTTGAAVDKPVAAPVEQTHVETKQDESNAEDASSNPVDQEHHDDEQAAKSKKRKAEPRIDIPGERRSERSRQAPRQVYQTTEEAPAPVEFVVPVGPGTKLRDIDYLADKISKCGKRDAEILKVLYQVMFSRRFSVSIIKEAKKNILDFSGYVPIEDAKILVQEKEKFRDELAIKLCRATVGFIDILMDFLQIERSKKSFPEKNGMQGSKDDKVERIIGWLESPCATEVKAKVQTKTKKSSKKSTGKPRSSKKKAEDDAETDDEEDVTPKKKAAPKRKAQPKKSSAPKKKAKTVPDEGAETESDNEDFEAIARQAEEGLKKAKTGLPEDIQARIKQIVTEGDVETLTLKTVMDTVGAELQVDLKAHKKAIKDFIANSL